MDTGVLMTDPGSEETWLAHHGAAGVPDFYQWRRGPGRATVT